MVIYDLICRKEHVFEGWFPSFEGYEEQLESKQLSCPVCGSKKVTRLPNACAVHTKKEPKEAVEPRSAGPRNVPIPPQAVSPEEMKESLIRLHHHVQTHFEDVGSEFTKEALRIHRGEGEDRPIHGTATSVDKEQLDDANVPYMALPKPELDS